MSYSNHLKRPQQQSIRLNRSAKVRNTDRSSRSATQTPIPILSKHSRKMAPCGVPTRTTELSPVALVAQQHQHRNSRAITPEGVIAEEEVSTTEAALMVDIIAVVINHHSNLHQWRITSNLLLSAASMVQLWVAATAGAFKTGAV
jgi:hypothetical protein